MKTCSKCGALKPLTEFSKHKEGVLGLRPDCKACVSARYMAWRTGKEAALVEKCRRYYAVSGDKYNARARAKRAQDPEKYRALNRASKAANREKNRGRRKVVVERWIANNPEKVLANARKQNAKRRLRIHVAGSYPPEWIETLLRRQDGKCNYCFVALGSLFHRDHIMPLALGGTSDPENIQLLCPRCNKSKGARHPINFALTLGLAK